MLGVVLATIFSTTKLLVEFLDWYNFDFDTITAIVDNYVMIIVLNNILLFIRELKPMTNYGIVTIGGTNYKLTHIGTTKITILDNDSMIKDIILSKALYFLMSLVNILSIEKMSEYYDNSTVDEGTCIKSTMCKSWFS